MTKKYICLHGHFYQPPRENPWLNFVEIQDSAYPYHDWNHRINAECYARNGASRILDEKGKIQDIYNNYSMMSFNMGPTLLAWMESEAPATYEDILRADKESQERFSGHGSALAQAYNHMIMPLANPRDQETQVIWGIEDFKYRFGRMPEGMWCGETAVNTDTLEVMAKHGIKFTILSPYQAKRTRLIGEKKWKDATDAKVDPRKAYVCNLPSGNSIHLFFYDGPASQGVAFEGLLENGGKFAHRLMEIFSHDQDEVQLAHIATDGESYGHHHRYGEMALSYCLDWLDKSEDVELTIYGEFLEKFPVEYEAEIIEDSSWSCYHGVERWRSNCGCNTGGNHGWHQEWREPLREAFDWVREKLIPLYEREMQEYTDDPWGLRNKYIQVVLDRSKENIHNFLDAHIERTLSEDDIVKILRLMEMQYNTMLMYTSCGWFFDEVTGIESMQDIFYATRAIQLAETVTGESFEEDFEALLEKTPSNDLKLGNAAAAFRKVVKPMKVDMLRVGAHYAVASLFKDFPEEYDLYNFTAKTQSREYYEAGKYKMLVGRTIFQSDITFAKVDIAYAVLHLGEHQLYGGVREYLGKDAYAKMSTEIVECFRKSDIYEIFNIMDQNFGSHKYSFWHLFRDEQRAIMELVLDTTLRNTEGVIEQMYEDNYHLLQVFKEINMKVPIQLKTTVDMAINAKLMNQLKGDDLDVEDLRLVLDAAMRVDANLDLVSLNFVTDEKVNQMIRHLHEDVVDGEVLTDILNLIKLINSCNIKPDYWEAQNIAFSIKNNEYARFKADDKGDDPVLRKRLDNYEELFKILNLKT